MQRRGVTCNVVLYQAGPSASSPQQPGLSRAAPTAEQGSQEEGPPAQEQQPAVQQRKKRFFGQRQARADPVTAADAPQLPDDLLQLVAPRKKKQRSVP